MDIQKEKEEFEQLPAVAKLIKTNDVWWSDAHGDYFGSDRELDCWIDGAWAVWQAKAQAVPEGFVLVNKKDLVKVLNCVTDDWLVDTDSFEEFKKIESLVQDEVNAMIEALEQK